ncbi:dual specificity protein phosphatase, putative, partial [Bodo saltans]
LSKQLLPLSFRPSQITSSYFIGNAQDAQHQWGVLATEHQLRLVVNCCAAELGADVYRVCIDDNNDDDQRGVVVQDPSQTDERTGGRPPLPRVPPPSRTAPGSNHDKHKKSGPPFTATPSNNSSSRIGLRLQHGRSKAYSRTLINSIRRSLWDNVDDDSTTCLRDVMTWVQTQLSAISSQTEMHEAETGNPSGSPPVLPRTYHTYIELMLPMKDDPKFSLLMWLREVCPILLEHFPPFRDHVVVDDAGNNNMIRTTASEGGSVFVHCLAGVSRSVSIVVGVMILAILRQKDRPRRDSEALLIPGVNPSTSSPAEVVQGIVDWIRCRRRFASPNPGFVMQLREFVIQEK